MCSICSYKSPPLPHFSVVCVLLYGFVRTARHQHLLQKLIACKNLSHAFNLQKNMFTLPPPPPFQCCVCLAVWICPHSKAPTLLGWGEGRGGGW